MAVPENKTWGEFVEESRRFDYYVLGANGVALGYTLQALSRIASRIDYLVPASWALLLIALGVGVLYLRTKVRLFRVGAQQQGLMAELGEKVRAQMEGRAIYHLPTDTPLAGQDLGEIIDLLREIRDGNKQLITDLEGSAHRMAIVRDVALIGGVAVFALWRFLGIAGMG